jgi:hypothetical protein
MKSAIEEGFLVPFKSGTVNLRDFNPKAVEIAATGDYKKDQLAAELMRAGAPLATARAYAELSEGRKAIIFTVSIDQAQKTAAELAKLGIAAESVSGDTPEAARKAVLRRLKTGETHVVCNAMVLVEGFDEPTVSCVMMAAPTLSRPLYVQRAGRGLRTSLETGKVDCLILDVVPGCHDMTVITCPDLLQEDDETKGGGGGGGGSRKGIDPAEEALRVAQMLLQSANLPTTRVQVKPPWQEAVRGRAWVLDCMGEGVVTLTLEDTPWGASLWDVVRVPKKPGELRDRLSDLPVTFDQAQRLAEAVWERARAKMKKKDGPVDQGNLFATEMVRDKELRWGHMFDAAKSAADAKGTP